MTTKSSTQPCKRTPIKRIISKTHNFLKQDKSPKRPCHFLRLPTILRLKIYQHVFADYDQYTPSPPFLKTCRTIRKEGSAAYMGHLEKICEQWNSDFKSVTSQMQRLNALGRDEEAGALYLAAGGVKRTHEVAYMRKHWEGERMRRVGLLVVGKREGGSG